MIALIAALCIALGGSREHLPDGEQIVHQSIPSPFDDPGLIALVACLVAILVIAAMVKS